MLAGGSRRKGGAASVGERALGGAHAPNGGGECVNACACVRFTFGVEVLLLEVLAVVPQVEDASQVCSW